jgi:hypothetical protein
VFSADRGMVISSESFVCSNACVRERNLTMCLLIP